MLALPLEEAGSGQPRATSRATLNQKGKATFGFVVKYKHEAAAGNLEFQYHVGDINLKSSSIT
ncbi:unnamed protein product, partial [marine sediment metagenome]